MYAWAGPGTFGPDAWRTEANRAVDWSWRAADPRERELSDRIQAFFASQGLDGYGDRYALDGQLLHEPHSTALLATNAVTGLAARDRTRAGQFVQAPWKAPIPSGRMRYYEGTWYLMALLHCSG